MINWGVIGLGNMANKFCEAIQDLENANLKAVASTSKFRLNKFCNSYSVEKEYQFNSYDDLINCKDVDAVYICSLNNTHFNILKSCCEKNKKILCEKPFVINLEQANKIGELILTNKIFFYEAIAYRSHPQTREILSIIENDVIGKIKKIESSFGFKVRKIKKESRLFNKEFGGGAILDLGCYPISFVELFRKGNKEIKITKIEGSKVFTGVDDHAEINYIINDDINVEIKVSLKENLENNCIIYGQKGTLKVLSPWLPEKKSILEVNQNNSYYKKFVVSDKSVYSNQINLISSNFLGKKIASKIEGVNFNQSLEIMKILETWKKKLEKKIENTVPN